MNSTPSMSKYRCTFLRLVFRVAISSLRPSSAKNSHCIGMMTVSAAQSALTVKKVERRRTVDEDVVVQRHDGGQHGARRISRRGTDTSSMGAPASWVLDGSTSALYSLFDDGPLADVIIVDQAGVGVGLHLVLEMPYADVVLPCGSDRR